MARPIGQQVKVTGGMKEFIGQVGTIIDNTEKDGRTTMYRVRFDIPVEIPGVGSVEDDIWSGAFIKTHKGG